MNSLLALVQSSRHIQKNFWIRCTYIQYTRRVQKQFLETAAQHPETATIRRVAPCFTMHICETFRFYNVINNYKLRKIATFRAVSRVKDTADILISRRLELSRKPLLVIRNVVVCCNSGPAGAYFDLGFFLSLRRLQDRPSETGADDAFLKLRTKPNFVHLVMYLLCTCYVLKDPFS